MKYLLIVLLLSSCSSAYHLKRAEKHVKRATEKGATWNTDTTFHTVKITTDPIQVKFEPKAVILNDTMVFEKNKVITKVLIRKDTVKVETYCPPIIKEIKVPVTVTKTINAKVPVTWWDFIVGLIIAFAVGYVVKWLWG